MHHLTAAGCSFVLGTDARGLPFVLHWGAALPDAALEALATTASTSAMFSALDEPSSPSIAASEADGWSGTPAFRWHAGGVLPARFTATTSQSDDAVTIELTEARTGGAVRVVYRLHPSGVLEASAVLTNTGTGVLDVEGLLLLVPVPDRAREILDFAGAWSDERRPQRHPVADGTWDRLGRRGRTGHDGPTLTSVGTPGFRYRDGELWSVHLAWSGNGRVLVERLPEGAGAAGAVIGAGELLAPGEIRLQPGESYATPDVCFTWSDAGLDRAAQQLHAFARSFSAYPPGERPVILNSWEAIYFDHELERLRPLVAAAAEIGVERFVLDDGWFLRRRDDHAGLGDWQVDPAVWPQGLKPLSDLVHGAGMQFGLWFEPEMVNPDSDLARAHPEWILADEQGAQPLWRHEQALNIGDPDAWQHVFDQVSAVVGEAGVDYIKWDHNRELHEAVDRVSGRAGVHRQTAGFYRMVDALRERHPGLEIESCASGGGRVDLGALQHTQRVWASDTIDPLERQRIQLGTELLVPLGELGTHIGAAKAHTTGRVTSLPFRAATALFGHAGIEWDVSALEQEEREALAAWIALYKEQRGLLHAGDLVHGDAVPDGALLRGVVDRDRGHGLFQLSQLQTGRRAANPRTPLPGLDPERSYRLRFREDVGRVRRRAIADPAWCRDLGPDGVVLPGALLTGPGVPFPALQPAEALLVEVVAV